MVPYIIGGVLLVVVLIIVGVIVAARMKGKLELVLPKGGYAPGEIIHGELKLTAKKDLEGSRLFVALVGYEETTRRSSSGGGSKTETVRHEIYREEHDLEGPGTVPAGTEKSYPFQMGTPNSLGAGGAGSSSLGMAGEVLAAGLKMLGNTNRKKVWEVQARYDIKGIDLTAKRRVTVSGG